MRQIRFTAVALAAFSLSRLLHADPLVMARVSSGETSLSEPIQLSVEIAGASQISGEPRISLPDFQVQRAGETRSFQWVNGKSASMIAYNYILLPTKTGTLHIPPITVTADGKTVKTEEIAINVRADGSTQSAAAPAASAPQSRRSVDVPAEGLRPLFMTATVDTDKAYVGQQILLRVQLLRRPDIQFTSQARYNEPEVTGFLVEPLKQQKYMTAINGAQYEVTELPYALFPTSDGQFAVGSAQIEVAVRTQMDQADPNSFFENFFGRSQVARLSTRGIPVSVRAMPKNKPANFSGAVGRYKMTAKLDATDLEVSKPVNLVLAVEGVGNIKALKEPFLPDLKGFRRYETISTSKVETGDRFLHGRKEFKILLMPQASGNLVIPSAQLAYFDPSQNDFVIETTPEIQVSVKPGNLAASTGQDRPAVVPPGAVAEGIRVIEKDIRFIKAGRLTPIAPPLYAREWFILLNTLPPLFAIAAVLVRRGRTHRRDNAGIYRARSAARNARRRLAAAKKAISATDPAVFYGPIQAALGGYIADKLSVAAAGLTRDSIEKALGDGGVDESTRSAVHELMEHADAARFAPSSIEGDDRQAALARADAAIQAMEKAL